MASISVKFCPPTRSEKYGTICYRIVQNSIEYQLKTDYCLASREWNEEEKRVIITSRLSDRSAFLRLYQGCIDRDIIRLRKIDAFLSDKMGKNYGVDDIVGQFRYSAYEGSFFAFMEKVIMRLKCLNRERTAENYIATLKNFKRFRKDRDVLLEEITSDLIQEYEAYLKAIGLTMNTISFYMRVLRAVYNRAVEEGMAKQCRPFRHVYTGVDKTIKRALSLKEIRKIKEMDLTCNPNQDFARDMFLFSFYTRGMSFIDMAYLKKSDLRNKILTYNRRKTGQRLSVRWEKPMQEIVNKYKTRMASNSPYLLPILRDMDERKARRQYVTNLSVVNRQLKQVSKRVKLPIPLSTYVARHSWASIAKNKRVPIGVISEGLGHDSEMTTRIYLVSLQSSVIDEANLRILKNL